MMAKLWIVVCLILPMIAVAEEFRSIYSYGDLILINPQQSTGIFLSVIVCSTLLEYVIEVMQQADNKYIRTIVTASKDEVTSLAFVQMLLLFVAFSFSLSSSWRTVLEWVVMCLVYMSFSYIALISSTLALLRVRASKWRTFEWARIQADAHHVSSEQLFKIARQYFLEKVGSKIPEVANCPSETKLVVFSPFVTRIERKNLREITDFSYRTWVGLGLIIIINGSRAITAASIEEDSNLLQILSFIGLMGYGTLCAYYIAHAVFERRFKNFLVAAALPKKPGEIVAPNAVSPQTCFFFGSLGSTLEVFKVTMLGMMWYVAVFIMAFIYVTWIEVGWWAILAYVFACLPVVLFCNSLPWTINVAIMIEAVGGKFDIELVRSILSGALDQDESSGSDKDDGEIEDDVQMSGGARHGSSPREEKEELGVKFDDEWKGRGVTFCDIATDGTGPPIGEPSKIIGVAPITRTRKYVQTPSRPVF